MKKRKIISLFLAIVLIIGIGSTFASCSSSEPAANTGEDTSVSNDSNNAEQTEYKYGKIDIPGKDGALCGAPIYIAYEKGFFAEEGFDVNLISADSETRKIGLNNGTIPIVNGDFQFFPSVEEGVNVSVVDGLHNGCIKFLVRNDSDIKNAEDLKGADPNDGEITFVPYSDGNLELEALQNGDIDVAALWDPFGSVAENEGKGKIIFDLSTDPTFAGKYCCFLYASNKVLEESPEQVAALLRAYRKAQDWISKNPEEAVDIIINGKYSAIEDRELAIELIKSYEYPSLESREADSHNIYDDVKYFSTELYNIGYLKTDPTEFSDKIYSEVDINLGQ